MEIYARFQPLLVGMLVIAIVWFFISSIFKGDFGKFPYKIICCMIALFLAVKPDFMHLALNSLEGFIVSLLGDTGNVNQTIPTATPFVNVTL